MTYKNECVEHTKSDIARMNRKCENRRKSSFGKSRAAYRSRPASDFRAMDY